MLLYFFLFFPKNLDLCCIYFKLFTLGHVSFCSFYFFYLFLGEITVASHVTQKSKNTDYKPQLFTVYLYVQNEFFSVLWLGDTWEIMIQPMYSHFSVLHSSTNKLRFEGVE